VAISNEQTLIEDDKLIQDQELLRRNKYWVVTVDGEESIRLAVGDYPSMLCADSDALLELVAVLAPPFPSSS
jgi:hypothetical protein